jgi:hypothetical protein
VVPFESTVPRAEITVPTVTLARLDVALDFVYVVDEFTMIVRVNPWGSVTVIVLPLTLTTLPATPASCTLIDAAVVALVVETRIPTCSPTTTDEAVTVFGPSLKVVAESMVYVVDVPLMLCTVMEVALIAVTMPPAQPLALVVVAVSFACVACGVAAEATPTAPAARPTPTTAVAVTRRTTFFLLLYMMILSLHSLERFSNKTIVLVQLETRM